MKVLYGYRNVKSELKDPVIAIGMFDGIHLGHRKILRRVLASKKRGQKTAVVTFDPHPQTVLRPDDPRPRIMSLDHRMLILDKMGVDAVIVISFTEYISMMSPEDFIRKVVIGGIGAKKVYVGSNFHFGRGKTGNVKSLEKIGMENGVDVRIVDPVKQGSRIISSTWLRTLIRDGNLYKASKLLRRPVSVLGTVVRGEQRGRQLGVATANIDPHHEAIPKPGVYAVKVEFQKKLYNGVLNIGYKPTFYGRKLKYRKEPVIEVHLLNFEGDIYGHDLEIFFVGKLRNEKKFKNKEGLKRQITKDVAKADKMFSCNRTLAMIKRYKKI